MKEDLFAIRDINDYPVLYTAIIDDIDKPEILTPTNFLEKYQ